MKKIQSMVLVAVGLFVLSAALGWGAGISVPGNYLKIQAAINAANPLGGDSIIVAAGTYNEYVTINKPVSIIGGTGVILTKPLSGSGHGFLIQAADVTIDGFDVWNFQIGIRTFGGPGSYGNLSIKNCSIHHNSQNGILIVYDAFNSVNIESCQINNNAQNGIGISDHLSPTILKKIDNLTIKDTVVLSNGNHGLYLSNTALGNVLIQNSAFDGSTTAGYCGITQGYTKSIIDSFKMTGGSLSNNKGGGFYIVQSPSSFGPIILENVTIKGNIESGVMFGGGASASSIDVKNCTFKDNGWEDFDLSGGWFMAFNVTGLTYFYKNTFSGLAWAKISIGSLGVFLGGIELRCNTFLGGRYKWGIANNNGSAIIDAKNNYWGDKSGPPQAGGSGTNVGWTGTISYIPWIKGAELAVDPNTKDYGVVNLGAMAMQKFTLTNAAACLFNLTIDGISIGGTNAVDFYIDPLISLPITLIPGVSKEISVYFKPLTCGEKTAILDIHSNDVENQLSAHLLTGVGRDITPPIITASGPVCVLVGNGKNKSNKITLAATDNCSTPTLTISKVEVFNNGGNLVKGDGIYRISGNDIYVNPNGNGWTVRITAIATDGSGNTKTEVITIALLKC